MSRYVAALVYRKKIGSMARKAILAYCAERANDDGSGVWASKVTIAQEVECSKQTVINTMRDFVDEGVLAEVGRRKTGNGYVVEYDLQIGKIQALEDAIPERDLTGPILDRSNELTPRGQTGGPQEVKPLDPNRPRTVLEPSIPPKAPDGGDLFSGEALASEASDFEAFWAVYPKKAGKQAAKKAWDKVCKSANPSEIIEGAKRYAAWLANPAEGEFRPHPKHPQGWLNSGRWADEEIWAVQSSGPTKPKSYAQKILNEYGGAAQ